MSMEYQAMTIGGSCLLASVTMVRFAQGQNPKDQGKGQRQIETTCTRVKDIRRLTSKLLIIWHVFLEFGHYMSGHRTF